MVALDWKWHESRVWDQDLAVQTHILDKLSVCITTAVDNDNKIFKRL